MIRLDETAQLGHAYRAFGMNLHSCWPLPRLASGSLSDAPDLQVCRLLSAPAQPEVCRPVEEGMAVQFDGEGFWAWLNPAGALSIQRGRIGVALRSPDDWPRIEPYLFGSGLALAMHMLGMASHHVAGLVVDQKAIAVTGASGEGKSTFSFECVRQLGVGILTDDLARIDASSDRCTIFSGFSQIKLWADALESFSVSTSGLAREAGSREKFYLPAVALRAEAYPLAALIVLQSEPGTLAPRMEKLSGAERLRMWRSSVYREELAELAGQKQMLTRHLLHLAAQVPVYRLVRPRSLAALPDGVACMMERLRLDGCV